MLAIIPLAAAEPIDGLATRCLDDGLLARELCERWTERYSSAVPGPLGVAGSSNWLAFGRSGPGR
jgi:hypothetical protein